MRGVKAKALRRVVYGDLSQREREYGCGGKGKGGEETVVCAGLRAVYRKAKAIYKRERR